MIEGLVVVLVCLILYVAICNYWLCCRNEETLKELEKVQEELNKLKLLNKLCVDYKGDIIQGVKYPET